MKKSVFYLIGFILYFSVNAQKIENVSFSQEGKKISVSYDLVSLKNNDKFIVSLYFSEDNGNSWNGPVQSVSGDVGSGQVQGNRKIIIWDVLADRKELIGEIIFEVRADIISSSGTGAKFTDIRDGKTYKTVVMNGQIWMAENLNYNLGDSWCYDENNANCTKFGRLYTWEKAKIACPSGWRLPNKDELESLKSNSFEQLISKTGFGILFGGWRNYNGNFNNIDAYANFWSSSNSGEKTSDGSDDGTKWYLYISESSKSAEIYTSRFSCGFSVRCIQDK